MSDEVKNPKIALALIENEGKFLLIRRKKVEGKLEWAFPGGAVAEGETDLLTAVREAKNEAGLEVIVKEKLFERKHPDTGFHVSYISCAVMGSDEPKNGKPDDIATVEWVMAEEVIPRFTSDVHPLIVNFIMSFVKDESGWGN